MTKVAESDSDVKMRHLREILKLTTKFINEVKNTEEVECSWYFWQSESWINSMLEFS